MKKAPLVIIACVCRVASAQDWSWTFQWGTNSYGLLFENANLETPVRCVIRDDLERALSTPLLSSESSVTCTTANGSGNGFTGYVSLGGVFKGIPDGLEFVRYTEHSGTNFFHVSPKLSAKYVEKIALTNAYFNQVLNMSNFFHSVSNLFNGTVNPLTRAELATKFWVASENRIWSASDISGKTDSEIEGIFSYRFLPPSLLDFETRELYGTNYLWCNARVTVGGTPPQFDGVPLVSVTNTWFFCNWW